MSVLGFALLANSLAMQITAIVAISGFLKSGGVNSILLIMFVDYAFILVTGALQSLVIDKFERKDLIKWVTILFAVTFAVLRLMFHFNAPDRLNYSIMYILAEQQFILFPLVFWVLASDIFKISQAKRVFPIISGWNFVGKLIGIGIAAYSPTLVAQLGIQPEEVLTLNSLVYVLAFFALWAGLRKAEVRKTVEEKDSLSETLKKGWEFMNAVPAFRYMMYTIIALAVGETIIKFHFIVQTNLAYPDQASYQTFFSIYRLALTLISLVLQAFVTGVLIKYMQLKNTFMIFPLVVFVGAAAMFAVPGAGIAIAVFLAVRLARDTVNESSEKSFLGLVPEERRGRVSTMMVSYLPSVGVMLACVVAYAIVFAGEQFAFDAVVWYLLAALLAGVAAVWAVLRLRKVYDESLLNWRLKRRQRKTQSSLLDKLG